MEWLDNPDLLLNTYQRLNKIIEEIDDEKNVPKRFDGSCKSVLADFDAEILGQASKVLHRLYLNVKYLKTSGYDANYVNFEKETTNA